MTYQYEYPRPSVTATVLLVNYDHEELKVIVGQRAAHSDAFANYWCLPGGFLNAQVREGDHVDQPMQQKPGETVEQTACREVLEETGMQITPTQLIVYHVHSDPLTDPRAHVVNICYIAVVSYEDYQRAQAGDDLSRLDRVDGVAFTEEATEEARAYWPNAFAFNHYELARLGVQYIRENF